MANQVSAPRGTKDILPGESYKWQYVEQVFLDTARLFGFHEHRIPTFEHTELFVRGVGDTTDVVQKEMYTFEDRGGRSITLRPEGTAGVVRSYVEHSLFSQGLPVKSCYLINNFRYEKPQAGRYREFKQFGMEYIGSSSPFADAEVIGMVDMFFTRLGIGGLRLEINSIGCPNCRPGFYRALKTYFDGYRDSLCKTCLDRLERNPLRILDCKSPQCSEIAAGAPKGLDHLCGECEDHFESVKSALSGMGVKYSVNPAIVRGLDYYTRTVFEFVSDQIGSQGTVCGGGRYDGLVEMLGGKPTPALGYAGGFERLLLVMEAQCIVIPEPEPVKVFVAAVGVQAGMAAQSLVHALRRMGVSAERDTMDRSLKAQMKYSGKLRAQYTLVLGDEELTRNQAELKTMETGLTRTCGLSANDIALIVNS